MQADRLNLLSMSATECMKVVPEIKFSQTEVWHSASTKMGKITFRAVNSCCRNESQPFPNARISPVDYCI